MRKHTSRLFIYLGLFLLVISQACNRGDNIDSPGAIPTRSSLESTLLVQSTPTTSLPQVDPLLVTSLGEVHNAVIQVAVEGNFIDPQLGENFSSGKLASGVIIDAQGLAITNNHIVTGATSIQVWVGGNTRKTFNAVVLGVSECSDLALIDIDGEGFSYFQWLEGDIQIGQEVFAAGYPLGNHQFILTDGVVASSSVSGGTSWSSVGSLVEHTASISPGNSGGALVDSSGKLVGINYAVLSESNQGFALGREETLKFIDTLRQAESPDSIGINGSAASGVVNNVPISGIWVRSVAANSIAWKAGIRPGDVIYKFNNEELVTDGSMTNYCNALRSLKLGSSAAVTVIRWEDLSVWEGQLNGNAIVLVDNFTKISSERIGSGSVSLSPNCKPADTEGYLSCSDDSGALIIDIPQDWLDFDGRNWVYDGRTVGMAISASPDLDVYAWNKQMPGLFFGASDTFAQWGGCIEFLDIYTPWYHDACVFDGRRDYNDGLYKGKVDYFSNCDGGAGANAYVLAAVPIAAPASAMIIISVQLPEDQGDILDHIWHSFYVGDF